MTPTVSLEDTTMRAPSPSTASIDIESTPVQSHAASYSSNVDSLSASPTPPLPTESPFHSLETESIPSSLISQHLQQSSLFSATPTPLAYSDISSSESMTFSIENHLIGALMSSVSSASANSTSAVTSPAFSEMSTTANSAMLPSSLQDTPIPDPSPSHTQPPVTPIQSSVNTISIYSSKTRAYDYATSMSSSVTPLVLSPTPLFGGTSEFLGTSVEFTPSPSGTFTTSLDAIYQTQILPTVPDNITESAPKLMLISSTVYEPDFTALVTDPLSTSQQETSSHEPVDVWSTAGVGVGVAIQGTMVLSGNCSVIVVNKLDFIERFKTSISSHISMNSSRITVTEVSCDPMEVNFTLHDMAESDLAEVRNRLTNNYRTFRLDISGQVFTAESVAFHSEPYADVPTRPPSSRTPPDTDDDGNGLPFEHQQRLIYIVIGVVVGFVVLLALIVVVHHAMRKMCKKSTRSFDIRDEPCIKLTDFNMAHTCIPRPRSIYSSTGADGKFYRYDDKERGGHPPASPTSSFMYANSEEIKEHYHEVIDPAGHGSVTPHTPDNRDFGRSGLPDWNLPLIDANSSVSPDLISSVDSHRSSPPSSSSGTFRPPSTSISTLNNRPVFSPPAPPPPPPPPLPTPILLSGTLQSRTSCDASSEMTDSSGDTNTLTKGSSDVGASMMGVDNPLMTPEEDYDYIEPGIEPSTSNRMKRYMIH
ncbi:uncharacterized protein [Diadema setosum]|uniref:uncharacterized protein n=1 Tax=Diadema setosum TaxID=31175 RepID=UPI003B3AF48B